MRALVGIVVSLCAACADPPAAAPAMSAPSAQAGAVNGGSATAGTTSSSGGAAGAVASGGLAVGGASTGGGVDTAGAAGSRGGVPAVFEGSAIAAVSLTYDDGLDPQLAIVQPALEAAGLRGTFFLSNFEGVEHDWALPSVAAPLQALSPRHLAWQAAGQRGHELAGHTVNHPCDDPAKGPNYKLVDYTMARMATELDESLARLARLGATTPSTFAYPCGSDKKGIGPTGEDFSPLIAARFFAARVSVSGIADPAAVDLLHVPQLDTGGKTADQLKKMVDDAILAKGWLVLLFHGVGSEATCNSLVYAPDQCMINYLTTSAEAHAALVQYLVEKKDQVWTAPFGAVAKRIQDSRK